MNPPAPNWLDRRYMEDLERARVDVGGLRILLGRRIELGDTRWMVAESRLRIVRDLLGSVASELNTAAHQDEAKAEMPA